MLQSRHPERSVAQSKDPEGLYSPQPLNPFQPQRSSLTQLPPNSATPQRTPAPKNSSSANANPGGI